MDSYGDSLSNARPAVPPSVGAGATPAAAFPGIVRPSTDFAAVRDGRRSTAQIYLVDLASARSIAANTHLILPLNGNLFYCDPLVDLSGVASAGIARVHFQDASLNPVGSYVTALPSSIFKVPFTQVLVENYAQPGKFMLIVYGVDIDIQPGASQQVQATILNANLSVQDSAQLYGVAFASTAAITGGTPLNALAAASNLNGLRVEDAESAASNGTAATDATLLAKATAPTTIADGDVICSARQVHLNNNAAAIIFAAAKGWPSKPIRVASGKRLDFMVTTTDTGNLVKRVLYTLF